MRRQDRRIIALCLFELGAGEILGVIQARAGKIGAFEFGVGQVCVIEPGMAEIRRGEIGAAQPGMKKIGRGQVSSLEVGVRQIN